MKTIPRYSSQVGDANKLQIKCISKGRNFGNLRGVKILLNLAKRFKKDDDSLTYDFDNEQHKIETVILNEKSVKKYTVLFFEKNFIENCRNITKLYIDRTQRTRLRPIINYSHFLTILADVDNKPLPIAWALLQSKRSENYEAVLEKLKKSFSLKVLEIVRDHHPALQKATEKVFPEASVKVRNLNYAKVIPKEPTITQFFDKLIDIQIDSWGQITTIGERQESSNNKCVNPSLPSSSHDSINDNRSSTATSIENKTEKSEPCSNGSIHELKLQQNHEDQEKCNQKDSESSKKLQEQKENKNSINDEVSKVSYTQDEKLLKSCLLKSDITNELKNCNRERLWRLLVHKRAKYNSIYEDSSQLLDQESNPPVTSTTEDCSTSNTTWTGLINKNNLGKIFVGAQDLTGDAADLQKILPYNIEVVGTVSFEKFWNYVWEIENRSIKEVLIVKFVITSVKQKKLFDDLYTYLEIRNKLGVFDTTAMPNVKDFYLMPFYEDSKLPSVSPFPYGSEFKKDQRSLLGIIVAHCGCEKRKIEEETSYSSLSPKIVNVMSNFEFSEFQQHSPKKFEQDESEDDKNESSFKTKDSGEGTVSGFFLPDSGCNIRNAKISKYLSSIPLPQESAHQEFLEIKRYKRSDPYSSPKSSADFLATSKTNEINVESSSDVQSTDFTETMSATCRLSGFDLMKSAEEIYAAALAETEFIVK